MAVQSSHLVDQVFPDEPLRQWVLTVPWPLRGRLAVDTRMMSRVLSIFVASVFRFLAKKTDASVGARGGAVTVIQKFGSSLNRHVHFHVLAIDGLYAEVEDGLQFHPLPVRVTDEDERSVAEAVFRRLTRMFKRRGWMDETGTLCLPELSIDEDTAAFLSPSAAAEGRFEGEGRAPRARRGHRESRGVYGGFSVHAGVTAPKGDKARRERLCRYATRPPFAAEQVKLTPDGRVRFELKHARASGETHLVFEPLAFLRRLAWLIPPPRVHLLRYHGVLAPASKLRAQVVPPRTLSSVELVHPPAMQAQDRPLVSLATRQSWASLLARVYALDVLKCDVCNGRMRVVAAIQKPDTLSRVLGHLGLPIEAPKLRPARAPPESELELWADA